ncbi:MAG: hypothetical protein GX442_25600 [Candidatus Riflebacteria bacterium]|nr:hypothetical protein [Candidatus Riflebacteria bacterium]
MKRVILPLVLSCFVVCGLAAAWADPCAIVNDPKYLRFVELGDLSKFLEEELHDQKGLTEIIGKEVIDRRFRKAGIPDPAKEGLSYAIVAREMPVDQLNLCFILKGNINFPNFVEFAEKRYQRYFDTLKAQKIAEGKKAPRDVKIAGQAARVFPYAFRPSEAVLVNAGQHTIIATVPAGDYSLVEQTLAVLTGNAPLSKIQPDKTTFMASFVPLKAEREEIRTFENKYEGFVGKTRKTFKKVFRPEAYQDDAAAAKLEQNLKDGLAQVQKFSYEIGATREGADYGYDINLIFRCQDAAAATRLKEMLLSWLAANAGKNLTDQDLVSLQANKVTAQKETCMYNIRLGASQEEQWQFSSMIMTLMLQDRRFNSLFKS